MTKPLNEVEKYYINRYGVVENHPHDMFNSNYEMAAQIIRAAMDTKREEQE